MTNIFLWIIKTSIQGGFVALVIMVLRLSLKNRPKRYAYALWLVVLARLLLPINIEASFSLMPRAVSAIPFLESSLEQGGEKEALSIVNPEETITKAEKSHTTFGLLEGAILIYGVGFTLLFLHFLQSHHALRQKMHGAKKVEEDIYIGKSIEMPFSYGIITKRIYLPTGLSKEEQEQIVVHERVHLERQDPLIKLVSYFVLLFHWFNPILWFSYILMSKDMEMSCDERALNEASKEKRYIYANALLRISEEAPKSIPGTVYFLGDVGQRLKNIFSFKKTTGKERRAFTVIFLVIMAVFITNPLQKVTGNVERVIRNLKPIESLFGEHLEVFEEGGQMVIGRLNHNIDLSFDKTKSLTMQELGREFLDEKTGMMIHESLHYLPGDTIYVEDDIYEVSYDEVEDASYLILLTDGFEESLHFRGDLRERFGGPTQNRVAFKFKVKSIYDYSDRFQILDYISDYNEMYETAGEVPDIETYLNNYTG